VTFVVSLLAGAFLLPESGVSWPLLLAIGAGYLLTAAVFAHWSRSGGMESQRAQNALLGLPPSPDPTPRPHPQA
jgi:hypothetical protein